MRDLLFQDATIYDVGELVAAAKQHRAKLKSPVPNPYWADPADLDRDAYELWAGGVAWDLRASAGNLVRRTEPSSFVHLHSAGYFPRYCPDEQMPEAAPLFTELTRAVWPDDEREWALNVLAVGFTGSPRKVLPVLRGERDSGKTTTVQMMIDVLGSYGGVINRKLLDGDTGTHDTIIMDLMGLRLAYLDEGMKKGQMARDRLKNIAGGGDLIGHRMRKDSVRFKATHTLVMSANPDEEPPLDDDAIRSRIRWIPCTGDPAAVVAAARKLDYFSSPAWKKEAPYVLGHMIVRCARVLADESVIDKHNAPFSVQLAEQAVAERQDDILQWFKESTVPEPGGYPARQLYLNFRAWFTDLNGPRVPVPSMTKWGRRMNGLIPDDAPDSGTRLLSASNTVLRRARPRPESFFGLEPSGSANYPANYPEPLTRENVVVPDSTDSTDTMSTRTYTRTHTHTQEGRSGENCPPSELTGLSGSADSPLEPESPRVTETPEPPVPPKPGKPKTPAQVQREADRRAAKALEREQARQAKIAELGGMLVPLPAIVTRDLQILSCTAADAEAFLQPFLGELSVDVEHSGYPVGHDYHELRLVQLGGEAGAVVLDPADAGQREVISRALSAAGRLHAHSALADLVPLEHAGLASRDAWDKMSDTVILAKLTDPKLTDSDEAALKPLARAMLGDDYALAWRCDKARAELFAAGKWLTETELLTPRERSGWANVPVCETFVRYAASDVMDCAAVARALAPALPQWLTGREGRFAKAFVPIALRGTPLDAGHIRELISERQAAQEAARSRVETATGGAITNPKSNAEVPAALEARGYALPRSAKTGKPGAPKGILEPLAAAGDELASDILEYRQHDTALGLLLRPWLSVCEHGDGRIRSNIMTIEARTGRTSSRNFNMQQVSRQGGMRACVRADGPDRCGVSADFNSVEIRVGAALSGDASMAELIRLGDLYPDRKKEFDFHWRTAITCYGEGATKENRYNSKRANFAKMFGSGKQSCANMVGIPLPEISAAFDAFDALAPQYAVWDQQMRQFVRSGGRSYQAYSGRQLWMDPAAEHGAGNTAIQGTARELMVDATLKWLDGPWGSATLLVVHDELIAFNIPADEAEAATVYLVQCMTTELHGVSIKAEANEPWTAWPDAS